MRAGRGWGGGRILDRAFGSCSKFFLIQVNRKPQMNHGSVATLLTDRNSLYRTVRFRYNRNNLERACCSLGVRPEP